MTPEFSRPERVETIGDQPRRLAIAADAGERAGLARRFGLIAIARLEAAFTVRREGERIVAEGRVTGDVTQPCAGSGEPLAATVDEAVTLRFEDETIGTDEDTELSGDALDILPIEDGRIDLGEAAAETLALAIDPFARRPDADALLRAAGVRGEDEVDEEASPFGALAALKRKLEE